MRKRFRRGIWALCAACLLAGLPVRAQETPVSTGAQGKETLVPAGTQGKETPVSAGTQGKETPVPTGVQGKETQLPAGTQETPVPTGVQGQETQLPAGTQETPVPTGAQEQEKPLSAARVRTEQITAEAEAAALVRQAVAAHADRLEITGSADLFQPLCDAIAGQLYSPLHTYDSALLSGCDLTQQEDRYTVRFSYLSTREEEAAVDAAAASLAPLFAQGSDRERVLSVHDAICRSVRYSYETLDGEAQERSAYDGLAHGTGICTTYALLFQRMMDQMGIPCRIAFRCDQPVGHAWNLVQLGGQWYHVDCTWDAQEGGSARTFCLLGADRAGYTQWGGILLAPQSLAVSRAAENIK